MGLEAATLIHELVSTNPVGASDPKSQGDDHLRMIKLCLLNTFPNIDGAVTASHTELNILDGVTATTADLNKTAVLNSGIYTPTASNVVNATALTISPPWYWVRIGNIVAVIGRYSFTNVNPATVTNFELTLPVARGVNFSSANQATGLISAFFISAQHCQIISVSGTEKVRVDMAKGDTGVYQQNALFLYQLTN